jgi:PAS domain S-box-containing protein
MKTELTAKEQLKTPPMLFRYGVTILSVAVAVAFAKLLQIKYNFEPFVLFLCGMMVSAWFGGFKPGLLALALSLLAFHYYFLIPIYHSHLGTEIPRLLVAAVTSFFVVWLSAAQRRATGSLRRTNESLRGEIAERKRTEALLESQKRVLETMAAGAPLSDSLTALTRLIEAQFPGIVCSILLLDERAARLHFAAAPSFPPEFVAEIDGLAIGPNSCSCGTAAYCKEPVYVEDIATDPRWKDYREVTLAHGLRACWSTPIFASQRQVLGTFAMFDRQPGLPQPEHLRLIEMATHIAAIAICGDRAQAVLRESEAKLKEAQRLARIGYWERDLLADRITWSRETCRIWGLETETAVLNQAKMQEMIYPDDRRRQSQALRDVLERGWRYDVEYRIVQPDGQIRFVHAWAELERDASGRAIRIFGTVQDITERKQAELLLHAQTQEIRTIVENSPDLIVRFDRQLRRTFVNTAFIKANGLPKEKLLGREIASAAKDGAVKATAEEIAILEGSLQRTFDTRQSLDFESIWPLATGRRTFTVHLEPEFDAHGTLTSILAISRDITDRKRAEEALRESQQLLHLVLATLPAGVLVTDRAGDILLTNAAQKRIWGDAIVSGSQRWAQHKGFWHDSGKRIAPANWASVRAISEGQTCLNELIDIETFDGQKKTIQNSSAPIRNAEGLIVGAVVVNEDVTERVRAEDALKDSCGQLRALSTRLQSVREEEATRIAREIHDDLGQKLTGLKMDLLRAERKIEELESSPTVNSILDSIVSATELTDGFTASIQQIAAELRPSVLDKFGLAPTLQYEAGVFERRTGIHCEVRLPDTEVILSSERATALFRILQESLTNVARHSHARKVTVELGVKAGSVIISVQDDGRGITEADIARPESLGLLGMRERAELLGGEIIFQRNPNGQGTVVTVRIPQMGEPV